MENKMTKEKAGNGKGKKRQLEVPVIPDLDKVEDDQGVYSMTVSVLVFTFVYYI